MRSIMNCYIFHLRIFFFIANCLNANCARILFVPAHGALSHTKSMYPAAEVLKRAGHDVHMLQLVYDMSVAAYNKHGVTDHIICPTGDNDTGDPMDVTSKSSWTTPDLPSLNMAAWKIITNTCVQILSQDSTRHELYKILDEHWDAVFVDESYTTCGLMAIEKRLAPRGVLIVTFGTNVLRPTSMEPHGAAPPVSTAARITGELYDYKNFVYRLNVATDYVLLKIVLHLTDYLIPYWGYHVGLRGTKTRVLLEESSLVVTCMPNGLDFTQPQVFNVIDLDPECPLSPYDLPEPFKSFLEDASSEGTILFAMGHYANWKYAPEGALDGFVQAFASLKQYRIIWQYDVLREPKPNVSSNVMVDSWIPQLAILNHPKTKLFISHMGFKSMREAICSKTPVLAMPMFGEQSRNTATAQYRGFGLYLNKLNLSTEVIYSSIKRLLDDNRYESNVHRLQNQLGDRIINSSDYFRFKVEFFLRNNDKRLVNSYMKPKWNRLSAMAQWYQMDIATPVAVAVLLIFILVL